MNKCPIDWLHKAEKERDQFKADVVRLVRERATLETQLADAVTKYESAMDKTEGYLKDRESLKAQLADQSKLFTQLAHEHSQLKAQLAEAQRQADKYEALWRSSEQLREGKLPDTTHPTDAAWVKAMEPLEEITMCEECQYKNKDKIQAIFEGVKAMTEKVIVEGDKKC